MSKRFQPTPEQVALQEARRLKKLQTASSRPIVPAVDLRKGKIVERPWVAVQEGREPCVQRITLMTWNLLAQCLVRRDLFPTSDCLKAAEREHMIYHELLSSSADIMCLQEVDRLEKLIPVIEGGNYSHVFAAGPRKKHGLLIAFRKDAYETRGTHVVHYDDVNVRVEGSECARKGSSFRTKNIASIVALGKIGGNDGEGIIVATTHLFWHPLYAYERARQAGILLREILKFREENGMSHWPCILAGDFNFPPDDPGYTLLAGDPLLAKQEERLVYSRVVHVSIDPSVPLTEPKAAEDDEDGDSATKKVFKNTRLAQEEDGLLNPTELSELFSTASRPRSAYDAGQRVLQEHGQAPARCGERLSMPAQRLGAFEPEWTSYTHYWKTVLDYIFVIDPVDQHSTVLRLLQPHKTESMDPGLPRKGVSGSDHVSLAVELEWHNSQ
ncbi:Endonuclease/exonuclease/phosphatase [Artomyces pyxidatus]|uniref:Endonuclease/exonuclease/phosphatase n=1 Tax=Artomyces pyxidatus TaxID=48021 RepID=A0ACB8TIU5_9AGAM|nr:Endonuclease/exonuclease/phosphatase [Artomyces pyxidatus]